MIEMEFEEYKGKKLRMSTGYSDFEGTLADYSESYLTLENTYRIFNYPSPSEYKRKVGKVHLPIEKIEWYGEV